MKLKNIIKTTIENLTEEDVSELLKMQIDDLIGLHHTLGQDIRNNFDLWYNESLCNEFEKEIGFSHPDDISNYIIEEVWQNLQDEYKVEEL